MAYNFEFPYTDSGRYNDDWLLATVKELIKSIDNFINLNTIKYANPILWNITSQYEANTVVVDGATGNAYISTKAVPSGVHLNNSDYWTQIYNYADVVDKLREQIAYNEEESTTATRPYNINDLVFVNDLLYRVIAPMIAGDSFVVDSNVVKTTIDIELKAFRDSISDLNDDITELQDDLTAEVNERELADETTNDRIDYLVSFIRGAELYINVCYPPAPLEGLDNTGESDNAAKLEAIIDYISTNDLYCTLYFPRGTYLFESSVDITRRNLTLLGETECAARLLNNSGDYLFKLQGSDDYVVNFVYFKNLYIYSTTNDSKGLYINRASYVYLENSRLVDLLTYVTLNRVTGAKFNEVLFQRLNYIISGVVGLELIGTCDSLKLFHTSFAFRGLTGAYGIKGVDIVRDITIESCSFSGVMYSVYLAPTDRTVSAGNIQILNNFFDDCYGAAIHLQFIQNTELPAKTNGCIVSGNYINVVGNQTEQTYVHLIELYSSQGVNITNNYFVNLNSVPNVEAVYCSAVNTSFITDNNITNMTYYGIRVATGTGVQISRNIIKSLVSQLGSGMIIAGCHGCSINDNTLSDLITTGINVTNTSTYNNILNNICISAIGETAPTIVNSGTNNNVDNSITYTRT